MLQLNGQQLTLQQIVDVAEGREHVALADEARVRVEKARQVVQNIVDEGRTVYGVNTGFGKLSDVSIDRSDLIQLQLNLVRSHSCGLGEPLSEAEARVMLLLRANVLAAGFSGARALVIETLVAMLEKGVTPGNEVKTFDTDFGRIGILICFDINWRQEWEKLKEMGRLVRGLNELLTP